MSRKVPYPPGIDHPGVGCLPQRVCERVAGDGVVVAVDPDGLVREVDEAVAEHAVADAVQRRPGT